MKFTFSAPSLTEPTRQTLEEFTKKSSKKLERLLGDLEDIVPELKITAENDSKEFSIKIELFTHKKGNYLIKSRNRDLRKAINEGIKELKSLIAKEKDKGTGRQRAINRIKNIFQR